MSTERKIVKVIGLIVFLLGFMALIPGIKAFVTGGVTVSSYRLFEGSFDLVFAAVNFAIGVLGIRGANTPSKSGPFKTLCLVCASAEAICLVVVLIVFGTAVVQFLPVIVPYFAVLVAGYVFGRKVYEKSQK
ncbi:MAG: hypothetical protein WAY93_01395 [Atopobiaceae bacterium]|jgi:hypothetical protein|nr:hypothetical protein [Atopobiaceae bacterium]